MNHLRDIKHSLPMQLLQARETTMGYFRPLLRNHNLTEQQWRVIRVLAEHAPIDATELANQCFLLPPSLTRILQALANAGLIQRQPDPADQRRTLVSLSPAGQEKYAQISPLSERTYQKIEERFGKSNLHSLHTLLAELDRCLSPHTQPSEAAHEQP